MQNFKRKNHTSHITLHTSQNGITLIALIITIIVMLILVGVTISVSLNGGLFTKASEASKQMQIEAEKEELLSSVVAAIGYDGKVSLADIELPTGWTGTNGTYTSPKGNTYIVDENGKIENEKASNNNKPEIPAEPVIQNPTLTAEQIDQGKYAENSLVSIKLVPTFYSEEQMIDIWDVANGITESTGKPIEESAIDAYNEMNETSYTTIEETGYNSLGDLICDMEGIDSLYRLALDYLMDSATYSVKKPDTENLFTCKGTTFTGQTLISTEGVGTEKRGNGEYFYFYAGSGLGTYEFTLTLGDYVLTASTTVEAY